MLRVGFEIVKFIRMLFGGLGPPLDNSAPVKWTFLAILELGNALRNFAMELDGAIEFNGFEPPQ